MYQRKPLTVKKLISILLKADPQAEIHLPMDFFSMPLNRATIDKDHAGKPVVFLTGQK